jgi:hypothetical protein
MLKEKKGLLFHYDGACKSGSYFDSDQLPKINGTRIDSIYPPCGFSKDEGMLDTTRWNYGTDYFKDKSPIGVLPKEIKALMGWQEIRGKKHFVSGVSFRTDSSGHASEDEIMTIVTNGESNIYIWYEKPKQKHWIENAVTQKDPYVKKWLKLFNKDFKVEYPSRPNIEWRPYYSSLSDRKGTFILRVDGVFYPVPERHSWCDSWTGDPFVSLSFAEDGYPTHDKIRVWDRAGNRHIFLEEVEDVKKGDEDLYCVKFPRDYRYRAQIARWMEGSEIVRYKVETEHEDGSITIRADGNGHKRRAYSRRGFYRLTGFRNIKEDPKKLNSWDFGGRDKR